MYYGEQGEILSYNPFEGMFRGGGDTLGMVKSVMDGLLVLVAAALFFAMVIMLVRQLVGTSEQVGNFNQMIKRFAGMLFIVFSIVFVARAGIQMGDTLFNVEGAVNDMTESTTENTSTEILITHHGDDSGAWKDGTQKSFHEIAVIDDEDEDKDSEDTSQPFVD